MPRVQIYWTRFGLPLSISIAFCSVAVLAILTFVIPSGFVKVNGRYPSRMPSAKRRTAFFLLLRTCKPANAATSLQANPFFWTV